MRKFKDLIKEYLCEEIDKSELKVGKDIEKEHQPTYNFIKKYYEDNDKLPDPELMYESIAKDHLNEISDYYTRLVKMEKEAEKINEESSNLTDKLIEFLKDNPNPSDKIVHDWADDNKLDTHEVEAEIYKLATKYVKSL